MLLYKDIVWEPAPSPDTFRKAHFQRGWAYQTEKGWTVFRLCGVYDVVAEGVAGEHFHIRQPDGTYVATRLDRLELMSWIRELELGQGQMIVTLTSNPLLLR